MMLPLQLSSMLPASVKAAPTGSPGKGTFDTALQEMMATPPSNEALLGPMTQGWPSGQAQMGTYSGANKPDQAIDEAHGVPAGAAVHQQPSDQTELPKAQNTQHPGSGGSPILAPPEPIVQDPILEESLLQTSNVRQLPGVIFEQGNQQSRQPLAGAMPDVSGSTKNASPHEKDKTETMPDGAIHPPNGQSSSVLSALPQPIELIAPVAALQPDGSRQGPSSSSSNATNSVVRGQGASHRARVQPMTSGESELRGNSLKVSEAQTMVMGANRAAKSLEGVPSKKSSEQSTDPQLTPPTNGKTNTVAGVPANQALHPKATHSLADGLQATGSQTDSRAPKDSEGKIGTEVKLEIKASVPSHSGPIPSGAQHQTTPNVSPAVFQGAEKAIAAHRLEASAAQVLQRMDMAPSGAIQLRADARRLDVGVSSAALGWVEVNATTGTSGRVDATVHLQNDASAQALTIQSKEISDYAREHSVQLGQVSVGVGTGDSARGDSRPARNGAGDENETQVRGAVRPLAHGDQSHRPEEPVSLISVRA